MLILGSIISSAVNKPRVFSPSRTTIHNKIRALSFIPPASIHCAHMLVHKASGPEETIVAKITWNRTAGRDDIGNGVKCGTVLAIGRLMNNSDVLIVLD